MRRISGQVAQLPKGDEVPRALLGAAAQNDVVKNLDLQQLAGAHEIARDLDVGLARRRVAAGMVMDQHQGGGTFTDRRGKYFARVNEDGVESALAECLDANQATARVQEQHLERFDGVGAVLFTEQVGDAVRSVHERRLRAGFARQPLGDQKGRLDGCRLGLSDSFDRLQFVEGRLGEVGQPPVLFHEGLGGDFSSQGRDEVNVVCLFKGFHTAPRKRKRDSHLDHPSVGEPVVAVAWCVHVS